MLEVKIKIREREWVNKDGEKVIAKDIKFVDLGVDQYIKVKKLYEDIRTIKGEKDGEPYVINKTMVEYLGEKVNVNLSPKSVAKWNAMPLGDVCCGKVEKKSDKGLYTEYEFVTESRKYEEEARLDDLTDLPF